MLYSYVTDVVEDLKGHLDLLFLGGSKHITTIVPYFGQERFIVLDILQTLKEENEGFES